MNAVRLAILMLTLVLGMVGATRRQDGAAAERQPATRFVHVDVYVDSGAEGLAAYQVEFVGEVAAGSVKLVGIEGRGEADAAFAEPPAYDPKALSGGRVILADYTTAEGAALPKGNTRVARLHLVIEAPADATPAYRVELLAAGSGDGAHIPAKASVTEGDDR